MSRREHISDRFDTHSFFLPPPDYTVYTICIAIKCPGRARILFLGRQDDDDSLIACDPIGS